MKKVGAIFLVLLILLGSIPHTDMGTVYAAGIVTVSGTVKVPSESEGAVDVAYQDATVTVTYPTTSGGTGTASDTTDENGAYSIQINDWTMEDNQTYTIEVIPKTGDEAIYDIKASGECTVTAEQIAASAIEVSEIVLQPSMATDTYSISVTGGENGSGSLTVTDNDDMTDEDDTAIPAGNARTVIATPTSGYEIIGVAVKKDDTDWLPDGGGSDWWKNQIDATTGTFEYEITSIDGNYEFVVTFAISKVTVTGSVYTPENVAYAGAGVIIVYPDGKQKEATTDDAGKYTFEITDWLIEENDTYTITVSPTEDDAVKYKQHISNPAHTVSAADAADRQITVSDISMETKEYTVTYTLSEGGKLILNNQENDSYTGSSSVKVLYTNPYQIKATVTDETKYHLTSVKIGDVEQLTQEDIDRGNDCIEKVISFTDGITEDIDIEVTTTLDNYTVRINQTGEGTVSLEAGTIQDNAVIVEYGADITFNIVPQTDYMVKSIYIDGIEISYADCTDNMDGSYQYELTSIQADKTVLVVFEEIPSTSLSMAETGVSLTDENGNALMPDTGYTCYAESITVLAASGKLLRLATSGNFETTALITASRNLDNFYLRDENPGVFGTEQRIILTPLLHLVIDSTNPEIRLTDEEKTIWKRGTENRVDITGTASDDNLDRVVWSTTELGETAVLDEETNVITSFSNGEFTISNLVLAESTNTDVFYLYAVDKAGHVSTPGVVTVYRDGTAPVVSEIGLEPSDIHKYAFGNFYNTTLVLKVTANDVDTLENGNRCPASGIKSVKVYADDSATASYIGNVSSKVNAADSSVIQVTIPIGAMEAFAERADLRLTVIDEMGNESAEYHFTDFIGLVDAGITSNKLMLESDTPIVSVNPVVADYTQIIGNETLYWYKEIPTVNYQVTDRSGEKNGSGLAAREIFLNNVLIDELTKDDYTTGVTDYSVIRQEENGTLTGENLAEMLEGRNTLEIRFTDLAGNTGYHLLQDICLDTHTPEITGFSIEKKMSWTDRILNLLTFGNYTNGEVVITVRADDAQDRDGNVIPSSGLNEITLYLDGLAYQTIPARDGEAVFELPLEEILDTDERLYLDKTVTASVSDMVGNKSAICDMTTGNSDIKSSKLMIETVNPVMTITPGAQGYLGTNGIVYNNDDTQFTVNVADVDSGLRRVIIDINGMVLKDTTYPVDAAEATKEDTYIVNTRDAVILPDGLYTVGVTVIDNAGNEASATTQVYKDETAPEIQRFEMQAEGTIEADGATLSFSEMDYGYYFHEDTRVTVYAADGTRAGDSGVKEIRYYTVDLNGNMSSVQTIAANAEGAVSFVIPAEFKGQVYACAYDWLLNSTERYVNPHSLIIETAEQHAREEHIAYTKADAPYRDSDGDELYSDSVTVGVTVLDTFSGIRKVEWSVEAPYDTAANQSGMVELDNDGNFMAGSNAEGWNRVTRDKNIVTKLYKDILVSNNSNDILIHVTMTDRAGNTTEKDIKFSIDRTKPTIQITFDNETPDVENIEMFKENRVATITVTERNFSASEFTANVTSTGGAIPAISDWRTSANAGSPDETTNTATITFAEDGDYTLAVSGHDRAGNLAQTVRVDDFTIDKTVPVITVTYDNENALNGNYYAAERTATIQIEEHNFSTNRVEITGTATDNGAAISFPTIGGWSDEGDVHTTTIACGSDGLYRFDVAYTDMAGNPAEEYVGEEYYVDMTEPEIEITGVEDMSANNGDVIPRIAMTDTNYDVNGVEIELTGANRGTVTPDGAYTAQGNGQIFTFSNFPKEQASDDIYTLTATLTDMAGNESTDTITFSVNRFGSVYVFDDSLKKIAGTYIQNEIDVRLTEVNVDSLEHDKIKVVVDTNGTPRDLVEGTDYTVQEIGGNGSWYQYDYTINKSLFAGDGRYIVTLYSEDVAGNINENIDESKEAEISFGVDKTAPVVIPIDIESDAQYALDTKSATVAVNDNLVLENVEVYIGDAKCEYIADGENYTFTVPSATSRQNITVAATDAAGNRTNYIISGVLVTTNAFIRWYNNKPLFAGSIAGVAAVSGGGVGLAFAFRSGRIKVRRRKK